MSLFLLAHHNINMWTSGNLESLTTIVALAGLFVMTNCLYVHHLRDQEDIQHMAETLEYWTENTTTVMGKIATQQDKMKHRVSSLKKRVKHLKRRLSKLNNVDSTQQFSVPGWNAFVASDSDSDASLPSNGWKRIWEDNVDSKNTEIGTLNKEEVTEEETKEEETHIMEEVE